MEHRQFADSSAIFRYDATPSLAVFSPGGEAIVTIKPDGTVIMNPTVTLDEAAKQFWEAVSRYARASQQGSADVINPVA